MNSTASQQNIAFQEKKAQLEKDDIMKITAAAIIVDLIEVPLMVIPVFGWILIVIIDFCAWGMFYMMFRRRSVKFNNFRRFVSFNSGLILDLIPFINTFAWTIDVLMVIGTVKKEEGAFQGWGLY
jgi:hypothetical protein